jgi:hypothetical protein
MNGAHCPSCGERGPDLVLAAGELGSLPAGIVATIRFTCGRCQRRWIWRVRREANDRLEYELEGRDAALEVDVVHERQSPPKRGTK